MARLIVERLGKSFGSFRALDDVSLDVADGEFVAILGPSGCGKTTLLRQVAGFDRADTGRILIGERVVSSRNAHVPPEQRRVGIVFQSYALWPHMSVAGNVAYGLDVAGIREPDRSRRVNAALALVNLEGFADRAPSSLSGGQRQRVALARCLVTEPSLVLLDEPLANLDVHLRAAMESEFARFHARMRTTMVYITHDQAEAMALADRIAVMHAGRVLQVASPSQLFREPADARVASFVGNGMVMPVDVVASHGSSCEVDLLGHRMTMRCRSGQPRGRASACLRASSLCVGPIDAPGLRATIADRAYQGGYYRVSARAAGSERLLRLDAQEPCTLEPGAEIRLQIDDGWVIPGAAIDDALSDAAAVEAEPLR